eukprot:8537327-Lingulodinium_polyedra.AAC.1
MRSFPREYTSATHARTATSSRSNRVTSTWPPKSATTTAPWRTASGSSPCCGRKWTWGEQGTTR